MQITRINGLATATMIIKLLPHDAPSLPSGVKAISRFKGVVNAVTILKLFPVKYFLTDENGDYITDEDGNRIETTM